MAFRLIDLPPAEALRQIWRWLEDCEDLAALNPHRDLPRPPFRLDEAWIVVRLAAEGRAMPSPACASIVDQGHNPPLKAVDHASVAINALFADLRGRRLLKWIFGPPGSSLNVSPDIERITDDVQAKLAEHWAGLLRQTITAHSSPWRPITEWPRRQELIIAATADYRRMIWQPAVLKNALASTAPEHLRFPATHWMYVADLPPLPPRGLIAERATASECGATPRYDGGA